MALIEIQSVDKKYGELRALNNVSLSLEAGSIGLLGPNGAGKSTLIKSLLGLVRPDAGSIQVLGRDVGRQALEVRAEVGYMPEGDQVIPQLSAVAYVRLAGELCGLPAAESMARAHQVLHYVGLGEARYRKLASFSTGMKQRARLAQALVGDPKLLLLDEPTSGLDPRGRDEMLQLIVDIPSRTGTSVVLSTHILPDVEKTCDQVAVLAGGEVLYAGSLAKLLSVEEGNFEVRVKGAPDGMVQALRRADCEVNIRASALEVRLPEGRTPNHILEVAVAEGVSIRHLAPLKYTLERAFLDTLESQAEPS